MNYRINVNNSVQHVWEVWQKVPLPNVSPFFPWNWQKKRNKTPLFIQRSYWHGLDIPQNWILCSLTNMIATCENRSYVWHMYDRPLSSSRIFCKMKVATVLLSSEPDSIILKHSGMISVVSKNVITSCSSVCQLSQANKKYLFRISNGQNQIVRLWQYLPLQVHLSHRD